MRMFLDTSAFAKRYVMEPGSDRLIALCQQADHLIISVICMPELISTLSRLVRESRLTKDDYQALKADVFADLKDMDICQLTAEVLAEVPALLESHTLRAMDAIHIACALVAESEVFVSADHRQLSAAEKAGLAIIDVS